jgi:hypothetical protein
MGFKLGRAELEVTAARRLCLRKWLFKHSPKVDQGKRPSEEHETQSRINQNPARDRIKNSSDGVAFYLSPLLLLLLLYSWFPRLRIGCMILGIAD